MKCEIELQRSNHILQRDRHCVASGMYSTAQEGFVESDLGLARRYMMMWSLTTCT